MIVVIGAGPAGLIAAETIARAGVPVTVFEKMRTPGRKLLLAGRGGLNLTHVEPREAFLEKYGQSADRFQRMLEIFGPEDFRAWVGGLGIETFVGSSGRVFPLEMKASRLLRSWLKRLAELGVTLRLGHRWLGWGEAGGLRFEGPDGIQLNVAAEATVLALGGASWPRTGSDGAWTSILAARGIDVAPLRPANMGFTCPWSEIFQARAEGQPVKNVALSHNGQRARGEFVITRDGIEGQAVYALSRSLRDAIERDGWAPLTIDLLPARPQAEVRRRLAGRGAESLSTFLRKALNLTGSRYALLREAAAAADLADPARLASTIKGLSLVLTGVQPLARAISTAGGVPWAELDERLMLKHFAGVFVAGEMLDWEAPTGGYLLQGCMATGVTAGQGVLAHPRVQASAPETPGGVSTVEGLGIG